MKFMFQLLGQILHMKLHTTFQLRIHFTQFAKITAIKSVSCAFFNWTPRHEGVLGEWRYSPTHSL